MTTISKIPFQIDFPMNILKNKKVNFKYKKKREELFKRSIYYYKYGKVKNLLLEKRNKIFFDLAEEVVKFLKKEYPHLDILTVSIFGSSLYSKKSEDFDFLIITVGDIFSYKKTKLKLNKNGKESLYSVGISIKGIDNFSKGIFDIKSDISLNSQSQVIYRTTVSLFRRHIPVIGFDFIKNNNLFLKNVYSQVSDLLNNAYELYYLKNHDSKLDDKKRSRKILYRIYEAISFMDILEKDSDVKNLRKEISKKIMKDTNIIDSKMVFDKMILLYNKKTKDLYKFSRDKKEVLKVLTNHRLKKNIKERLENYWRYIGLPYQWIPPILEILSKYHYDEDLAIEEVRKKFSSITDDNSLDYSKKLKNWRNVKIRNLAKRIEKDISGEIIADIGGRTDDFSEQILILKKSVKKAYVTDLCSFTARSKNPKISFVVQSSPTKLPFPEKSINTVILSMVLHHLKNRDQEDMIKNLVLSIKDQGKIILIEDTYPKKVCSDIYDRTTKDFLEFNDYSKKRILYFYDWFGNRLMRNRDNIHIFYNYRSMEEWREVFEKFDMKEIKSEFVKINKYHPDIFPPKAILIFQKK